MKTLRLRRNVMKLAIYRHFANIVVFMVVGKFYILTRVRNHDKFHWAQLPIEMTHPILYNIYRKHDNYSASVIFILWDIQTHRTGACIEVIISFDHV